MHSISLSFEYSDGVVTYPVMKLAPDSSAAFYGNVGIGTTDTKGYKLAVAGGIVSESVRVKLRSNWRILCLSLLTGLRHFRRWRVI